jgi:putative membrane protein
MRLTDLFPHRPRPEPAPDVGLAAERTAMAWQRTALALAAFSALLVHLAERELLLALPGLGGLVLALVLLVQGERRYIWTVRRIEAGASCTEQRLVVSVAVGVGVLSVTSLLVMAAVRT